MHLRPRTILLHLAILLAAVLCGNAVRAQTVESKLSNAQLEQLAAPIALYPDALLAQVLMASTYPTEVVEAARWSREHPEAAGSGQQSLIQDQKWDPSVKALTVVPQPLQMMSDKLDWTQQLGNAVLAQQQDLLDAVQRLRQRAQAAGHLETSTAQKVTSSSAPASTASGKRTTIVIEPQTPDLYFVPVFDPRICYGAWPYPAYEPFYWRPAGFAGSNVLSFAAGVAVGYAVWGHVDWWGRRVDIDVDRYNSFNRTQISDRTWRHDPRHRGSVPYEHAAIARRYGQESRMIAQESLRKKTATGPQRLASSRTAKVTSQAHERRKTVEHKIGHSHQLGGPTSTRRTHVDKPARSAHRVAHHRTVRRGGFRRGRR